MNSSDDVNTQKAQLFVTLTPLQLGYVHSAIKRACRVARGRAGYYGSHWTSNPAKAAQYKAEADYLRELLVNIEAAKGHP